MFPVSQSGEQGLGAVLGALAEQAAAVQRVLDRDYQAHAQAVRAAANRDDPAVTGFLDQLRPVLSPSRLRVSSFTVDLRCDTAWRRSHEGAIRVRPINLGWELACGTRSATATRFRVEIEQAPPAANPESAPASDTLTRNR